jgi:hypothetical protein
MASEKSSRTGRHLVTLADLAPRREIKGGSDRCLFGSNPVRNDEGRTAMKNITPVRAAKPKVTGKDLMPKSPAKVKGGVRKSGGCQQDY